MLRRSMLSGLSALGAATITSPLWNSSRALGTDSGNWQGWRGYHRTGIVDGVTWPNSLDEKNLTVAWTQLSEIAIPVRFVPVI